MQTKYFQDSLKVVYNIYTGDESWIYAYEPETEPQSTIWVFQDKQNSTKVIWARSSSKQMIACFFDIAGHMATMALEQSRRADSECYTTIWLTEVIGEILTRENARRVSHTRNPIHFQCSFVQRAFSRVKKAEKGCIILHHSTANSHTSAQTKDFLKCIIIE